MCVYVCICKIEIIVCGCECVYHLQKGGEKKEGIFECHIEIVNTYLQITFYNDSNVKSSDWVIRKYTLHIEYVVSGSK